MAWTWTHEQPAHWDTDKLRIVGGAPSGIFTYDPKEGERAPGEWWRVQDGDAVVGYGWMESTWGDAEILLAVDPEQQGKGVGTFILEKLEHEAKARGLNHLYNTVPETHPEAARVTAWLKERQFVPSEDGTVLRRTARPED